VTMLFQVLACKLKTFIGPVKAFQRKSDQIGTFAGSLSLHYCPLGCGLCWHALYQDFP
jgi:hypothetical protein